MKLTDAGKMLTKAGFTMTRNRKHQVWRHDDGRVVTLPLSSHRDLYGNMAHKVKRYAAGRDTSYQRQTKGMVAP